MSGLFGDMRNNFRAAVDKWVPFGEHAPEKVQKVDYAAANSNADRGVTALDRTLDSFGRAQKLDSKQNQSEVIEKAKANFELVLGELKRNVAPVPVDAQARDVAKAQQNEAHTGSPAKRFVPGA